MGLLSDCHFLFEVKLLCLTLYILKFCHLKIVSGAMDARKCSAKWRNWNISHIFFSLSSIEGRNKQRWLETFAQFMGTMPLERAHQENCFLVLRRIALTLMTLHVRGDFRVWWRSFKNINLQWSTLVYSTTGKCEELWPSCDICIQWARFKNRMYGSKIGCMGTACPKPKPQKSAGGHNICISACSPSIDSWTTTTIFILYRYWLREMVSLC